MLEIFYVTQSNIVNELSQSSNSFSDILKPYINFKKLGFISFQDLLVAELYAAKQIILGHFTCYIFCIFSGLMILFKLIPQYLYSIQ